MKMKTTQAGGTVEILATNNPQTIPATITGTSVVKAGMPIDASGAAAPAGTGAIGILLYDVDPTENPNAALVVGGIVDWKKCTEHSGATATASTMKGVLSAITFRENIGVTADDVEDDEGDDVDNKT